MISFITTCNITIGEFLKKKGFSQNNIFYLIKEGNVKSDTQTYIDKNQIVKKNEIVKVKLLDEKCYVIPTKKPFSIIFEDDYLLIVDKSSDLDIEPTKANNTNTLSNHVAAYYLEKDIKSTIHLVNRLDKVTSGLVIFAKNRYIHNLMQKIKINKEYIAMVNGIVDNYGIIKVKLIKDEKTGKRIESENGKECITEYSLISTQRDNSLVKIKLHTGRTHQIRASFNIIGHPLCGDPLYNEKDTSEFYLRAYKINFIHPITKEKINLEI